MVRGEKAVAFRDEWIWTSRKSIVWGSPIWSANPLKFKMIKPKYGNKYEVLLHFYRWLCVVELVCTYSGRSVHSRLNDDSWWCGSESIPASLVTRWNILPAMDMALQCYCSVTILVALLEVYYYVSH